MKMKAHRKLWEMGFSYLTGNPPVPFPLAMTKEEINSFGEGAWRHDNPLWKSDGNYKESVAMFCFFAALMFGGDLDV